MFGSVSLFIPNNFLKEGWNSLCLAAMEIFVATWNQGGGGVLQSYCRVGVQMGKVTKSCIATLICGPISFQFPGGLLGFADTAVTLVVAVTGRQLRVFVVVCAEAGHVGTDQFLGTKHLLWSTDYWVASFPVSTPSFFPRILGVETGNEANYWVH